MDELHQLAKAYYRAGSPELKNEAQELFNSLDNDGDGRVDKNEFVSFMTEQGYRYMNTQKFFNELDTDGNHTLDFWEVMTLLYIFKSRRPFCDGCGRFIPATYFTCLQCPNYDLCISCYENGRSGHNHQFMDNYALLAVKKRADMNEEEETEEEKIEITICALHIKQLSIALTDPGGYESLARQAEGHALRILEPGHLHTRWTAPASSLGERLELEELRISTKKHCIAAQNEETSF
nr:Ca2+ sensor (EF-Hand superfamily) [Ipomoea batatas]